MIPVFEMRGWGGGSWGFYIFLEGGPGNLKTTLATPLSGLWHFVFSILCFPWVGPLKEYTGLAEIPSDGPVSYKRIRLGRF